MPKKSDQILDPLKKIKSRRYWRTPSHPHGAGDSVTVELECGHELRYKGSQEPLHKARCWRCGDDLRAEYWKEKENER